MLAHLQQHRLWLHLGALTLAHPAAQSVCPSHSYLHKQVLSWGLQPCENWNGTPGKLCHTCISRVPTVHRQLRQSHRLRWYCESQILQQGASRACSCSAQFAAVTEGPHQHPQAVQRFWAHGPCLACLA